MNYLEEKEQSELVKELLNMVKQERDNTICVVKTDRETMKELVESNNELMINYDSLIKESNEKNATQKNIIMGLIFAFVLVCGMICIKDYLMWHSYLKTPSDVFVNASLEAKASSKNEENGKVTTSSEEQRVSTGGESRCQK